MTEYIIFSDLTGEKKRHTEDTDQSYFELIGKEVFRNNRLHKCT
jgi:hypothetical protein